MCGRFFVKTDFGIRLNDIIRAEGIVPLSDFAYEDIVSKDVCPSQSSVILHACGRDLAVSEMQWGFTNPYKKGLIINARAETAREKNLFSDSISKRRCIIPASGFYEWDPYKARFRFTAPGDGLIFLAGFFHEENGENRYTILTTEANESMERVHDRMPVMISREEIRPWIYDNSRSSEFLTRRQPKLVCEQDSGQIRMDFSL